jgi:PTS system nitrogen regulatory IIA component
MGEEVMGLQELAAYLQRDARDVSKWASRGYLPAHKVSGEWRFHRAEINHWIETQMHAYTEEELLAVEQGGNPRQVEEPLLTELLSEATTAVPLQATTRTSVLRQLVAVAEQSWQVYDPEAVLVAIQHREEMGSTSLDSGVAIPHPRRPLPDALGESVIAYGRTATGIPFGAEGGGETDIFFLVCCRDDRTHLRVLARLSRLLLRPGFLDDLRAAETPSETFQIIDEAERDLIG